MHKIFSLSLLFILKQTIFNAVYMTYEAVKMFSHIVHPSILFPGTFCTVQPGVTVTGLLVLLQPVSHEGWCDRNLLKVQLQFIHENNDAVITDLSHHVALSADTSCDHVFALITVKWMSVSLQCWYSDRGPRARPSELCCLCNEALQIWSRWCIISWSQIRRWGFSASFMMTLLPLARILHLIWIWRHETL